MAKSIMQRVDEHTHVRRERLVPCPPFPDAIKIEVTSRCNFNCSYCATKRRLRSQGDVDVAFLFRLLHQAREAGVREVGLFLLGESLLVPRLAEYVRYAKEEAGIEYVFLTTNGALATPERMIPLIRAGIDSVKFSVNAGTREQYRLTHGADAFDTVLANIRWLQEYRRQNGLEKPRTCVSSIRIGEQARELEGLRALVSPYVDDFYFLPLYNQGGHVSGASRARIVGNPGRLENMVPPVPCWALFNGAKVTWDGWLTACCFDHDARFKIADLNRVPLAEAWTHPSFVALRSLHLAGDEAPLSSSLCGLCLGLREQEKGRDEGGGSDET